MSARASDPPSTTRKPPAVSAARSRSRPCATGAGIAAAATIATTGPLVAAGCAAGKRQTTAHVRNSRIVMASRVSVPFVDRVQDSDFAERDTLAPGLTLSSIACARRPAAPPPAVTFTRDIAPIAFANCVPCHRQGKVASDAEARSHQAGRRQFAPAASAVRHLHDTVQRRTSARGACDENASELYAPSSRVYRGPTELTDPFHDARSPSRTAAASVLGGR